MDKIFNLLHQIYKFVYNQPSEDPNGLPITQIVAYESKTDINLPENTLQPTSVYIWGNNRAQINYGDEILGSDILVPQVPDFLKNYLLEKIKNEVVNYETQKKQELEVAKVFRELKKEAFLLSDENKETLKQILASRIRIPHQVKPIKEVKPLKETKPLGQPKKIKPWRSISRPKPFPKPK